MVRGWPGVKWEINSRKAPTRLRMGDRMRLVAKAKYVAWAVSATLKYNGA